MRDKASSLNEATQFANVPLWCAQIDLHLLPFHDIINSRRSQTTRLTCRSEKLPWQHGELNVTTIQLKIQLRAKTWFAAAVLTTFHLPQLLKLAVCLPLQRHIDLWLTHSPEQRDFLQANHRRAYSQFRWVWPFALRPALQCPPPWQAEDRAVVQTALWTLLGGHVQPPQFITLSRMILLCILILAS